MHTRRFGIRSLLGAVAALGVAAALAGPASAGGDSGPPARTGYIHEDCDRFGKNQSGDRFELQAYCRTSDSNTDKAQTSIDLAANIGNDDGYLTWGQSLFHKSCRSFGVTAHDSGVELKARCDYRACVGDGHRVRCSDRDRKATLELGSYYKVNSAGNLAVR